MVEEGVDLTQHLGRVAGAHLVKMKLQDMNPRLCDILVAKRAMRRAPIGERLHHGCPIPSAQSQLKVFLPNAR